MTLLGPAQGKALVLNLCVGMVVTRCFTADTDPNAFICGQNSNLLVTAAVGKQSHNKHEDFYLIYSFGFIMSGEISGKCLPLVVN